jgi:RNA polymerase sigma-70 factor (ECF subfamily)
MSPDPLDALLERLSGGDMAAAEQAFQACEPYLRMVVRRQLLPRLRPKFDSMDIVQSVWADLLPGLHEARWRFDSTAHFRAFLVQMTRNRFIDRLRQHRVALDHERSLTDAGEEGAGPGRESRPSEVARANELWERMLLLCPPAHREVLRLKHEGYGPTEIAARTGLHPGSVRRILYDLTRRLAALRDA